MQEYETIRKHYLKPGEFEAIERFLEKHPHLFLSDVYYNQKVWDQFKSWQAQEEGERMEKKEVPSVEIQDEETTYMIVRFYQKDNVGNEVIKRGLTLEEAKEHCSSPDTEGVDENGPWFDGFVSE